MTWDVTISVTDTLAQTQSSNNIRQRQSYVWRIKRKAIRTVCAVLCNAIVHSHVHNDMSSSYGWTVLDWGFVCVYFVVLLGPVYVCYV